MPWQRTGILADEVFIESATFKLANEDTHPILEGVKYSIYNQPNMVDVFKYNSMKGNDKNARRFFKYAEDGRYVLGLMDISSGTEDNTPAFFTTPTPNAEVDFSTDEFFPLAPIMESQYLINSDKETPQYITTRRLLRRLNLNINDITDGLLGNKVDGVYEANPDFDKLDDVYFILASDIYSNNESSVGYQYHFFDYLMSIQEVGAPEPEPILLIEPIRNYIQFEEREYIMKLSWDYITIEEYDGVLPLQENENGYKKKIDYIKTFEIVSDEETYIYIEFQITPETISKLTIVNLHHDSIVAALGSQKLIEKKLDQEFVDLYQSDDDVAKAAKAGTAGFYLPVSQRIMQIQNYKHQQIIITDSMTIILYAATKIDLAWYQTGWFRILITVAMIVITIYAPYLLGWVEGGASAVTAAQVVTGIAQGIMVSWGLELIIAELDGPLKYLAIIAAIYVGYKSGYFTKLKGMPAIDQILAATNAVSQVTVAQMKAEMSDLAEDSVAFQTELKERQEEFDEAEQSLDYDAWFASLFYNQPTTIISPNESPEEFFFRTIGYGNLAQYSVSTCSVYVDDALKQPEPIDLDSRSLI